MDVKANKTVGESLKKIRLAVGLTQGELAIKLEKPQSYVSKIESGERSLRLYELFDYSEGLGVEPGEVVRVVSKHLGGDVTTYNCILVKLS